MGGAGFPPCWLFCLRQPNTGAYLGSLVGLMADSGSAHAKEYFPKGPRTAMKSDPCSPQLEKALAQKRRPKTAINPTKEPR